MNEELQRAFDLLWSGSESRSWIKGRLGRVESDDSVTIKTGRVGFVHVRLGPEGDQGVHIARNLGVPLKPHLPVRMRLEPNRGYLVIHGVDFGSSADSFDSDGGTRYTVGPHTHAIRSGLEYPLEALRFNPGRAQCDSGLTVTIKEFRYYSAGAWDTWTEDTISLSSDVSGITSGKWVWILVGIDPATNTAVSAASAEQDNQTDLTSELIDTISFAGYIPVAAVQATSSDTSLSNIDRWHDARGWLNLPALDVNISSPADGELLTWDSSSSKWQNEVGLVRQALQMYVPRIDADNTTSENVWGACNPKIVNATALNSGSPIVVTTGVSKLLFVINAGSDVSGSITITGTTVDPDDASETGSDTDSLTIDSLTTDNSTTDANGNTVLDFEDAYITAKIFKGSITISTTDVTLTDIDVYQISYTEFDKTPVLLRTFELVANCTHTDAWADLYLYHCVVQGDKCDISTVADLHLTTADSTADRLYTLRNGALAHAVYGSTGGIFAEMNLGPLAQEYWKSINLSLWYDEQVNAPLV